ncbi:dihydrodipicolinate synthase family protein [Lunatimonas salinarum]|uniref:dihydrodipicolinate synthase family protein n=1 Tax=Lunatimonas salinarum TaxID=1774590 RepID=UPI001AE001C2|nr:dihydrodipicolinate synthase family protein [Lunatimonas salinarum]
MNSSIYVSRRNFLSKLGLGLGMTTVGLQGVAQPMASRLVESPSVPKERQKFIPVMLTVYKENGAIDYSGMSRLMDYYLQAGATGFFANCLSSEMYHLSSEERIQLTNHVVKHVGGKIPVVATGSFGENVRSQADFAKKMRDTGVDAVILITSHFAEKSESDGRLIQRLDEFLQDTDGIRMGTYECPSPYKRIVTPAIMDFMVASERFIYHKDTTEDIAQIRAKLDKSKGTDLEIYNAHIGSAAASLQYGGAGLSPIAGNFYPDIITWMCDHASNPRHRHEVEWLQERLRVAEQKIGKQYQLGARYFLSKRGFETPVKCRSTDAPLERAQMQVLDNLLTEVKGWQERLGIDSLW